MDTIITEKKEIEHDQIWETGEKEIEHEQVWETVEKAAPVLNLSQQGLYAAIRQRQLPPEAILRIGRRIRINLKAVRMRNAV